MATLATIRGNLNTELAAVVTSGELKTALHGRAVDNTGMPYARYYFDGFVDIPVQGGAAGGGDVSDWKPIHRYRIEIIGDAASGKTISQQEIDFYNAIDAVKRRLEANSNLGDNNDIIIEINAQTGEIQGTHGKMLVCEMTLFIQSFDSY